MIGAPAGSPRPEARPSTPSRFQPPAPGTTWLVALGYTALALAFTWPLALGLARDVPGDLGDSLLNMWILEWGAQHAPRLLTGSLSWQAFWNGNIFHPEPYALALSEHLFAQALQIAPVYALTGNIILCYNLVFLSTFVVSAIGAYLLVRDLTSDWRAGVIAGLVYGFLPYRISQIPHVQIMSSQWMPLALWGFYRYVDRRSRLALAGGTAALVLQNWSCGYYLLFFAPFVPLFAVQRLWATGRLRDRAAWGGLATAGIATVVCTVPFLLPYREVQRLYGFDRGLGEVLAFSANVWSYATAAEPIHLWGHVLRMYPHGEGETFLGVTAPLLALVALVAAAVLARRTSTVPPATGRRRVAAAAMGLVLGLQAIALLTTLLVGGFKTTIAGLAVRASTPVRVALQTLLALAALLWTSPSMRDIARRFFSAPAVFFAALMLLAMWLSLGPDPSAGPARVSGIGLYSLLYDYVPGFTGLRVPARYAMIAGLFLAMTTGYGAAAIARRSWGPVALAGLGVLIIADGAAMPLQMNHTWGTRGGHSAGPRVPGVGAAARLSAHPGPAGRHGGGGVPVRRCRVGNPRRVLRGGPRQARAERLQRRLPSGLPHAGRGASPIRRRRRPCLAGTGGRRHDARGGAHPRLQEPRSWAPTPVVARDAGRALRGELSGGRRDLRDAAIARRPARCGLPGSGDAGILHA
ncbi:MAG TPA: hypothetical protein PLH72_05930 [Vicinamibacterales bacterium]|nr:hypothetical protein [Vicinamibacterales bacterium]